MTEPDIQIFEAATKYLAKTIQSMLQICVSDLKLDIWIETVLSQELKRLIDSSMIKEFPDLSQFMPQYSYRLLKQADKGLIGVHLSIQTYINKQRGLSFLGNYITEGMCHDLYLAPYYDGINSFLFYARYGHMNENFTSGASDARSQYHLGMESPLSVAYGMAVHDGYING